MTGEVQLALGETAEAIRVLEQALALRSGPTVASDDRANTEFALAQALWSQAAGRKRSIGLARAAVQHLGEAGAPYSARQREVQAWLTTRERRR